MGYGLVQTRLAKLSVVKKLVEAKKIRSTYTAQQGATALGFDIDGMLSIVMALEASDFYKSMATHNDHRA